MKLYLSWAGDILLVAALLAVFLWAGTAKAQSWLPLPSTPDVSVAAGATVTVPIPGNRADHIFLQNDCSSDVYFELGRIGATPNSNNYPLRLAQDKQFQADIRLFGSIGASPAAGASACTITVIFGSP